MAGLPASRVWNKTFNRKHLKAVFLQKVKGKPTVGLDWVTPDLFEKSLDHNIDIILRKCNGQTYSFTRYREKLISKGAKKPPRCISIPTVRDKLVLSALNELLISVYGTSAITKMPQIIVSEITKSLHNPELDSFIKTDIKTFYASINRQILMRQLKKKIRKPEVCKLIEEAVNTSTCQPNSPAGSTPVPEKGIPEGIPISNALANLYLAPTDAQYNYFGDCLYWRYVDDILILTSHDCVQKIRGRLTSDIAALSLNLNEEKTISGNTKDGFEFLGYFISPAKISVRRSSIIALERAIETIFRRYSNFRNRNAEYLKWKVNLKITGFILNGHKYGWLFFYSQIDDLSCLAHLDWLIKILSQRFSIEDIHFKSFMKAHHEITKALHTTTYIPNLDRLTIDEKRHIVQRIYNENIEESTSDSLIDMAFKKIMNKEIRDVQKDVQSFS